MSKDVKCPALHLKNLGDNAFRYSREISLTLIATGQRELGCQKTAPKLQVRRTPFSLEYGNGFRPIKIELLSNRIQNWRMQRRSGSRSQLLPNRSMALGSCQPQASWKYMWISADISFSNNKRKLSWESRMSNLHSLTSIREGGSCWIQQARQLMLNNTFNKGWRV